MKEFEIFPNDPIGHVMLITPYSLKCITPMIEWKMNVTPINMQDETGATFSNCPDNGGIATHPPSHHYHSIKTETPPPFRGFQISQIPPNHIRRIICGRGRGQNDFTFVAQSLQPSAKQSRISPKKRFVRLKSTRGECIPFDHPHSIVPIGAAAQAFECNFSNPAAPLPD